MREPADAEADSMCGGGRPLRPVRVLMAAAVAVTAAVAAAYSFCLTRNHSASAFHSASDFTGLMTTCDGLPVLSRVVPNSDTDRTPPLTNFCGDEPVPALIGRAFFCLRLFGLDRTFGAASFLDSSLVSSSSDDASAAEADAPVASRLCLVDCFFCFRSWPTVNV